MSGNGRIVRKIVATRPLTADQMRVVEQAAPGVPVKAISSRDELLAEIGSADVLFVAWNGVELDSIAFASARNLVWIHAAWTGVDRMLIPEIVESGVIVTNSRTVHAVPVAEHGFALLIALAKNLNTYERNRLRRAWDRVKSARLNGSTIAVVGFGTIGREIASRARSFGMRVLAVRGRPERGRGSGAGGEALADEVCGPADLGNVLAASDYVVVALPMTRATRRLIGAEEIASIKSGGSLVNVSRGGIVDEVALAGALRLGRLAGAAMDVFEEEPLPPDSPLWDIDNLIITPHVAGSTPDHIRALTSFFAENLRRWMAGENLLDVVDKHLGY